MVTMPKNYIELHPEVVAFVAREVPMYWGGQRVFAQSNKTFETLGPSTGNLLAKVAQADQADVDLAVAATRSAYETGDWHLKMTPSQHSQCLWRLADLLDEHKEILGQLDALDNGKPLTSARDVDVHWSVEHFRYFAGWPTKIEGSTIPVSTPGMFNYTVREPVGVCGLIMPWNYPLLMACWKMAPALAAGNYIILKPAEQTPLSALYLPKLFEEAGFPPGVLTWFRGSAKARARPWWRTTASTKSDSPAARKWPVKSSKAQRATSNGCHSNSAAKAPTSCLPMPI